jgi:hypothetical protein
MVWRGSAAGGLAGKAWRVPTARTGNAGLDLNGIAWPGAVGSGVVRLCIAGVARNRQARRGLARLGMVMPGRSGLAVPGRRRMVRHGLERRGGAMHRRHGRARQGWARRWRARLGIASVVRAGGDGGAEHRKVRNRRHSWASSGTRPQARQGLARLGRAGWGEAWHRRLGEAW